MNRFELWILRRALARAYKTRHARETTVQVFRIVYQQLVNEFTGTNRPTTYAFITECMEIAIPYWLKTRK